jgi:hypothetical protein
MRRQSFVTPAEAGVHQSEAPANEPLPISSVSLGSDSGLNGGSRPSPGRRLTQYPHAAALILVVLGLALAGCGKKNQPQPPPGVPNTYPRIYPSV